MTVTLSAVVLLGVGVAAALKFKSLSLGGLVLAGLFGFYLASTDAADSINQFTAAVSNALGSIGN
ncbi:hypothetical protein [Streptomyces reniochalinae]|uniref:DUF2304 family protein n=1 Tax=Streptomyces reniochalinae TaxID=2250578 RepID=A0A367E800_9ACTN|nr:hypothetical protein [Streptomyces reniochalinae]RCG14184.1 hypothetical protein DQ392_29085 [Streptomyces reniochalinae]